MVKGEGIYTSEQFTDVVFQEMRAEHMKYIKIGARSAPAPEVVAGRGAEHEFILPDAEPFRHIPRRPTTRRGDFERHGFTAGCPECARLQSGIGNSRPHTTTCRTRLETAMRESDSSGRQGVAEAKSHEHADVDE